MSNTFYLNELFVPSNLPLPAHYDMTAAEFLQHRPMKATFVSSVWICFLLTSSLLLSLFLAASMVSPDKGRRTTLTPSGPSSGTALLGPSLLDCNSHDSFQSRGLPDVAEVS